MKQKCFHRVKISGIMEIVEGLKFSCFTGKFNISGVFLEVFDVFISVVHTKALFKICYISC